MQKKSCISYKISEDLAMHFNLGGILISKDTAVITFLLYLVYIINKSLVLPPPPSVSIREKCKHSHQPPK